jgi:5-methylcytosine-specific restriction endonuclease McrA
MPKGIYVRTKEISESMRLNRLGKKDSTEARLRKSICKSGKLHPAWKGGISVGDNRKSYMKAKNDEFYRKNIVRERSRSRLIMISRRAKEGKITKQVLQRLYEDNIKRCGTLTCYLCLKELIFGEDCIEHKTPLSRGGNNLYENLGISHRSCTTKKKSKTLEEYHFSKPQNQK